MAVTWGYGSGGGTGGTSIIGFGGNGYSTTMTTATTSNQFVVYGTTSNTVNQTVFVPVSSGRNDQFVWGKVALGAGAEALMPDGSVIKIDANGNYRVISKDAKVIYQACRIREFNRFLNASDLLEKFIDEVGRFDGVDQDEVLRLPIEAFINWLILEAAKTDGDSLVGLPSVESALPALPAPPPRGKLSHPRCASCGRFIKKAFALAKINFCNTEHFERRLTYANS